MKVKDYTNVDKKDLEAMKIAATEINETIKLAHSSRKAFQRLMSSSTANSGFRHFKKIVKRYYSAMANEWLNNNDYKSLPSPLDEWNDINGAVKAYIIREAGIQVSLHNGWASYESDLI